MELVETLRKLVGQTIKMAPAGKRQAYTVAKLESISDSGRTAFITPKGHRRQEEVPIEEIRIWKKGLALNNHSSDTISGQGADVIKAIPPTFVVAMCILDEGRYYYWTPNRQRWSKEEKEAQEFVEKKGANIAAGLANGERSRQQRPEAWRKATAMVFEKGCVPRIIKQDPIAPAPTVLVTKPVEPVVEPVAPTVSTASQPEAIQTPSLTLFEKWERARRDVLTSELMRLDAQKVLLEIECEMDINRKRKELGHA